LASDSGLLRIRGCGRDYIRLLSPTVEGAIMRAHTAGSFAVFSTDGENVTPKSRKSRALLAYLISEPGTKVAKTRIVGLLWGDRGEEQARSSLRQALLELRNAVNGSREIVCCDRDHVWVSGDTPIEETVDEESIHKDAFEDLEGISPEFDNWVAAERRRRSSRRVTALKGVAEALLREGLGNECLTIIAQMQEIDPYDEDALRMGMEADFQCGHSAGIFERYRRTAAQMLDELGVQPSAETRELRDRLIGRLTIRHQHEPLSETDQEYFTRRAHEERAMARSTESEASRSIHEDLASRYEEIALPLISWNGSHSDEQSGAGRFLRRSLVIRAARWFKPGDHPAVVMGWPGKEDGYVDTPEGRLRVDPGDWIITGISGENYPCKPHTFDQLYLRTK
jgi:DNA-binding SARP family transcriptional activator